MDYYYPEVDPTSPVYKNLESIIRSKMLWSRRTARPRGFLPYPQRRARLLVRSARPLCARQEHAPVEERVDVREF